jgi:Ras family
VLVGNKNDMVEKKCVQTSKARKFAEFHDMPFYETSAKDDREEAHIEEIFTTLAKKLLDKTTTCPSSKRKTPNLTNDLVFCKATSDDDLSGKSDGQTRRRWSCLC